MLRVILVLGMTAFTAGAEQVSCKTGQIHCAGSQSLSVVSNNHFCCDNGFSMQWKNEVSNGTSVATCVCNRHFYESDCIEGLTECSGATGVMSDGATVKCCKSGDSMNSASNSFINGVRIDYCKCVRYINTGGSGGLVNVGGVFRPMTDTEASHLTSSMNQLSQDLQTGLSQMTRTLGQNLGLLGLDRGHNQVRQLQPGNWAANFLEGLGQTIRRSLNPAVSQPLQSTANVWNRARTVPVTSPRPMWDVRQRRFQQLQRRLQQQRQQSGTGGTFLDRLSRTPMITQIMSPGWWLNQNWGGMFGMGRNQRNSTTQSVTENNTTNDGNVAATNQYNTQLAQSSNSTA